MSPRARLGTGAWPAAIVVGAVASIALLAVFFHPWLALGAGIDLLLLWSLPVAHWAPAGVTP